MSSERWLEQTTLFDLTPTASGIQVWLPGQGERSHGGCWTADTLEWPSGGDGFSRVSLSEILLRIGPDEPYWLSPKACAGHTGQGGSPRKGSAGSIAEGAHRPGEPIAFDWQMHCNAGTLPSTQRTPALSANKTPAVLMTMREGKPGGGKGPLLAEEQSLTLATGNGQTLSQPQAFRKSRRAQSNTDDETWVADGGANTLNVFDVGDTRTTHAIVEPPTYGVRRLTPVECERLQSFPDGWTEPAGSDSPVTRRWGTRSL
jgi:hypothetical protein